MEETPVGKNKVLVVDDDASIRDLIVAYLKDAGYQVRTAIDGQAGLAEALTFQPDVIVLDIMLPGIDGLEVLTRLRRDSDSYVILLTAKSDEVDKLVGLAVGADDYVTKPFSPRELVARIKAALRRLQKPDKGTDILEFDHLTIDFAGRRVLVEGQQVDLTTIEFDLLQALVSNRGRVMTRTQLIEAVWGYEYYGDERIVDVHLGHLRSKLGLYHGVTTVRGVGYRFEDER